MCSLTHTHRVREAELGLKIGLVGLEVETAAASAKDISPTAPSIIKADSALVTALTCVF